VTDHILLIDDEDLFREDLASLLRDEGFLCRTAPDGETGLERFEEAEPDLVLCDLVMPGMGGVEVIDRLGALASEVPVLLLTAHGTMDSAVGAFRRGAADYLLKPVSLDELLGKIRRALEQRQLVREVRALRRQLSETRAGARLIGSSRAMKEVRRRIERVAEVDSTVLVCGESGTGKELAARSIHEASPRRDRPFVAVNCAALPRELFESELFGHMRGAFTGAHRDRQGYFELADGGTLFLDEISELPLDLQPKLLRAIEQQEFLPIGGSKPVRTDIRFLAATNRDLAADVEEGRFRRDLFYRLRVMEIALPALHERREDVPLLVEHFVQRLSLRLKRRIRRVEPDVMRTLMAARWQGNVRELENVLERAMILAEGETVTLADLPADLGGTRAPSAVSDDLREAVRAFEREHIGRVLEESEGNREEAARRLGVDASTLYRRLKEL